MTITCCKECHEQGNSYIGCHSKCEKYLKERDEHEIEKEKRRQDKMLNSLVIQLYNTRTGHKNKSVTKGKNHRK